MDVPSSSSISTLQTVKERMREKLNGSLKAVKLQTSLAAKIKTKTLNNSSFLKVSLKNNNKALACALTAEKEKSKRLGNDKMFLQKEVTMLHFQNALLRQNLSIVNKTLKDIDVFMNINLSAAIKISSTMESSDRLSLNDTKSERFSQQSTFSLDENQCFRLTGVALRVPSSTVGQPKYDSHQTITVNEENHLLVPPPPIITAREDCEKDKLEAHALHLSPKEPLSLCIEDRSRESPSNMKVGDCILPLDEVFSPSNRNAQSGGFVTRRRKRSAVSHSRRLSKNDSNQAWGSSGTRRDSGLSSHWEMNTDFTILPDLGDADFGGAESSVMEKNRRSINSHCSLLSEKLDAPNNSDVDEYPSIALCKERPMQSTNQPELVLGEESDLQTSYLGQEKTVYEADMEITASESASIIAVLPKKKTRASKKKSCLPVSQTSTLRRVKAVREKPKKMWSSVDQEVNALSSSSEKGDSAKLTENLASTGHYDRRTYVLLAPDVEDRFDSLDADPAKSDCPAGHDVLESGTQPFPDGQVLDGEKTQRTFTLKKEYCTEAGNIADIAPKATKSKNLKEASKTECSSKKKRKMYKQLKNQEQITEENMTGTAEQIDSGKKINAMPSIDDKILEPKFQREINIVSAPNDHPSTNDLSNIRGLNYRRATVMIPEPSPLVSVTLNSSIITERNETLVEPQHGADSSAPKDVPHKIKNRSGPIKSDCEGEQCNPISDPQDLHDHKKPIPRCSRKKESSTLFSKLDKRKTYILPSKENDLTGKAPLVRESFMNRTSSQSGKASKFPDIVTNKNDSFMLDMVSESILDDTMCSSFAEFPSATNPESNFSIDMSFKSVPALALPVPEDCNGELSSVSNNICVQDENDNSHQKETCEMNQQCKIDQDMEICETAIKPFQDLTNKCRGSTRQSGSEEDESQGHTRRRRNPVNYKEPRLGTKLRRGDFFTDTSFLPSPAINAKGNQAGRQNKKVKSEERAEDA